MEIPSSRPGQEPGRHALNQHLLISLQPGSTNSPGANLRCERSEQSSQSATGRLTRPSARMREPIPLYRKQPTTNKTQSKTPFIQKNPSPNPRTRTRAPPTKSQPTHNLTARFDKFAWSEFAVRAKRAVQPIGRRPADWTETHECAEPIPLGTPSYP